MENLKFETEVWVTVYGDKGKTGKAKVRWELRFGVSNECLDVVPYVPDQKIAINVINVDDSDSSHDVHVDVSNVKITRERIMAYRNDIQITPVSLEFYDGIWELELKV